MRSHLALVVVVALAGAGCTRTVQHAQSDPCRIPRVQRARNGIGIIGMSLDQQASTGGSTELIIDRVVPDGPAATAGIRAGDRILTIQGTPTAGMSIGDAARRLRGPVGASITLVIATGTRPRDVLITRVAPSDLWNGAAGARQPQRVLPSDVAPAEQVSAPPCRQ
jgi:membrane-associated protease RseP (regulator of RpoE activity)